MTRYLERALAGDTVSPDDWNQHLITFHDAFPDVTPGLIARFKNAGGETSYEYFARYVREQYPSASKIVEIGCGSGPLLRHLDSVFGGNAELIGIDLVASELEIAHERVPRATLVRGDVSQTLPVQAADVAVAHLSLLSMARLRDVLHRIHDALRPGGALICIIEDLAAPDSVLAMMAPLMRALADRRPSVKLAVPERDSVESEVTLRSLLRATGFTGELDIDDIVLWAHLTVDQLVEFAIRTYPFGLLEEPMQSELCGSLRENLMRSDSATRLVKLPLKLVTAHRKSAMSSDRPSTVTEFIR